MEIIEEHKAQVDRGFCGEDGVGRSHCVLERRYRFRKLALLDACLSEERQKEMVKYLSDTTGILFSVDILTAFCDAVGIVRAGR